MKYNDTADDALNDHVLNLITSKGEDEYGKAQKQYLY